MARGVGLNDDGVSSHKLDLDRGDIDVGTKRWSSFCMRK